MSMSTARDLFLHELSDALSAEHIVLKALPVMAEKVGDEALADALSKHEDETKQQIENLEKVFELLGEKPEKLTCHGAAGLTKEFDSFLEDKPAKDVLDVFTAGAATKTEHYEIDAYSGLVDMANLLGETEVAKLLEKNLKQEEAMAKKAESMEKKLAKALASSAKDNEGKKSK